ncbi:hypothetical protein VTK56DRAFT_8059 [Thermocarpiscus australiensis]
MAANELRQLGILHLAVYTVGFASFRTSAPQPGIRAGKILSSRDGRSAGRSPDLLLRLRSGREDCEGKEQISLTATTCLASFECNMEGVSALSSGARVTWNLNRRQKAS